MHTARKFTHLYQRPSCILIDPHRNEPIMVDLRKVLNESTSEPTSVAGYSRLKEGEELIVELLENVVLCRLSGSDEVQGIQEGLRWLLDRVEHKKAERMRERKRDRKIWKKWETGGGEICTNVGQ